MSPDLAEFEHLTSFEALKSTLKKCTKADFAFVVERAGGAGATHHHGLYYTASKIDHETQQLSLKQTHAEYFSLSFDLTLLSHWLGFTETSLPSAPLLP